MPSLVKQSLTEIRPKDWGQSAILPISAVDIGIVSSAIRLQSAQQVLSIAEARMALERERQLYSTMRATLLAQHEGKFALLIAGQFDGVYETQEDAYRAGLKRHGNVPMLIQRIERVEHPEVLPALTLGLMRAGS